MPTIVIVRKILINVFLVVTTFLRTIFAPRDCVKTFLVKIPVNMPLLLSSTVQSCEMQLNIPYGLGVICDSCRKLFCYYFQNYR